MLHRRRLGPLRHRPGRRRVSSSVGRMRLRAAVALALILVGWHVLAPNPASTQEVAGTQTAAERIAETLIDAKTIEYLWYIARDTGQDDSSTGLDVLETVAPGDGPAGGQTDGGALRPGTYRAQIVVRFRTDDTWDWYAVRFGVRWDKPNETIQISAVHNLQTQPTGARDADDRWGVPLKDSSLHTVQGAGENDPNVLTAQVCQLLRPWMRADPGEGAVSDRCPQAPSNAYTSLVVQRLLSRVATNRVISESDDRSIHLKPVNHVLKGDEAGLDTTVNPTHAVRALYDFLCPGGGPGDVAEREEAIACTPGPDQRDASTALTNTAIELTELLAGPLQDFRNARFHPLALSDPPDAAHRYEQALFKAFRDAARPRLDQLADATSEAAEIAAEETTVLPDGSTATKPVGSDGGDGNAGGGPEETGEGQREREQPDGQQQPREQSPAADASANDDAPFRYVFWALVFLLLFALTAITLAVRLTCRPPADTRPMDVHDGINERSTKSRETDDQRWQADLPSERGAAAERSPAAVANAVAEHVNAFKQALNLEALALAESLLNREELDQMTHQFHQGETSDAGTEREELPSFPPFVKSLLQKLVEKDNIRAHTIDCQAQQIHELRGMVDDLSRRVNQIERQGPDPDPDDGFAAVPAGSRSGAPGAHAAVDEARDKGERSDQPWAGNVEVGIADAGRGTLGPAPTGFEPQRAQSQRGAGRQPGERNGAAGTGNGVPPAFQDMLNAFAPNSELDLSNHVCRRIQEKLKEAVHAHPDDETAVWRTFGRDLVEQRLEENRAIEFYEKVSQTLHSHSHGHLRLILPAKAGPLDGARMRPVETALPRAGDVNRIRAVNRPGIELSGEVLVPALVSLGS